MSTQVATILPYRSPRSRNDATAALGLVIFLGSWAMMFLALFFAYAVIRAHAESWPPEGTPRLPLLLPGVNTLVIALSSVALHRALSSARAGRTQAVRPALFAATALGVVFLALQAVLWLRLWNAGLRVDGGPYLSVFWALTVFHGLHVLAGLLALVTLAVRGAQVPSRLLSLRLWAAFWHFVGAVWIALYLAVFVA